MSDRAIVLPPGQGHRIRSVEFLARTVDTPRFNLAIIEIRPGGSVDPHVHAEEDDAFYVIEGEMTFDLSNGPVVAGPGTFVLVPPGVRHGFRNEGSNPVRMMNVHAPGGFDQRIGLPDSS